jgi:hypothetical protein
VDINLVPSVFTWIRQNWITFISISFVGLILFATYQFIDGYAKPFGESIASEHNDLKRAVASYTALDSILTKDLIKYKGSRVGLFRLHDNERDVSHMAFFFVSVANMVAAPGIAVDLPSITNLPAATYTPVLPSLINEKPIFTEVKSLEDGPLRELEDERGARAVLFVPIVDLQDDLIGFISIDWVSDEDVPTGPDRDDMINSLDSDATRISGYFSDIRGS